MKKLTFTFLMMSLLALFFSCKKDETSLSCSVEYAFQLPTPLMEIADAYVEYTDNGKKSNDPMQNGKWSKTFSYEWEDDAVNKNDYGFNTLKIILKPKVPSNQFKEGVQLLKDSKAYFTSKSQYSYISKQKDSFSGSQTNTSHNANLGNTYVFTQDAQDYKYTVTQQIAWFNSQDIEPFWDFQFDHLGTTIELKLSSNVGQPEE